MKKLWAGFTIAELVIVIAILGILAALGYTYFAGSREQTYYNRAVTEFQTIAGALKLYAVKHNDYPADVSRGLPPGLEEFLTADDAHNEWPTAPWPGSVYDYDRWQIDDGSGNMIDTYQISIRFCPAGGPLSACQFPKQPWAENFGVNSAFYYCITGLCRAHNSEAATYPGYCQNCPNNRAIGT